MGIGNEWRGDDGLGPYLAEHFKDPNWLCLNCGTVPENFTSVLRKNNPERVVIVDAASMELTPGEIRVIPEDKIEDVGFGTHSLPITHVMNFIKDHVGEFIFIGIQPSLLTDDQQLSNDVLTAIDTLMTMLKKNDFSSLKKLS